MQGFKAGNGGFVRIMCNFTHYSYEKCVNLHVFPRKNVYDPLKKVVMYDKIGTRSENEEKIIRKTTKLEGR